MSLLDNGPDSVDVFVEVETTDAYGNVVMKASDTPVTVRGRVQPSTSTESEELGQVVGTTVRFVSRTFPANAYGQCDFDGQRWDILGSPRKHRGSAATTHVTTYLKARGS